jgi:hypothetical protein
MSLRVTVVDEQTGETEIRRVATGSYIVIAANPCYVDRAEIAVPKMGHNLTTQIITVKNYNPQLLEEGDINAS